MQQMFFLGGFSAVFLYLVVTVYCMTYLHQNFASFLHLHSVHNKILLTNNCASFMTSTCKSVYGYSCFSYFIPKGPYQNLLS